MHRVLTCFVYILMMGSECEWGLGELLTQRASKLSFKAFSLSHQLGLDIAIQEHPTFMTHRMLHYHINYLLVSLCPIYC